MLHPSHSKIRDYDIDPVDQKYPVEYNIIFLLARHISFGIFD